MDKEEILDAVFEKVLGKYAEWGFIRDNPKDAVATTADVRVSGPRQFPARRVNPLLDAHLASFVVRPVHAPNDADSNTPCK